MPRVILTVSGLYPAAIIKPELVASLALSIEQHAKAYGLKGIAIQSRVELEEDASGSQGGPQ